jgi:DUF1680 family protein
MRQIALLGHYIATTSEDGIQIHQYIASEMDIEFGEARSAKVRLETAYPWEGQVKLVVEETGQQPWELALRVPAWCEQASVKIGDDPAVDISASAGGYTRFKRTWKPGDVIRLNLALEPRLIEPNPRVDALRGSLAVAMGPLVYCFEGQDQPAAVNLADFRIDPGKPLEATWDQDLLGGVNRVKVPGALVNMSSWENRLYRSLAAEELPHQDLELNAVPYYAWANREPGTMRVWMPRR